MKGLTTEAEASHPMGDRIERPDTLPENSMPGLCRSPSGSIVYRFFTMLPFA
jgi:hypothetical protein